MNLLCAVTIILNLTTFEWNDFDSKTLRRAKHVCATNERYADTPCLKEFRKVGERDYQAICSEEKK